MTETTSGSSDRGQKILPSQHGEDVPLILSSAYVGTPRNGVGSFQVCLQRVPRQLGTKDAYPAGHRKDVFGLFPG